MFCSDFLCNKNGTILKNGDVLKNPKLAETLETIGWLGAEAFYSGKIGRDLIEDIKATGWFYKIIMNNEHVSLFGYTHF